ncbi:hypothetical protein C2G38_2173396 [Gigaspora rosea]|uniref:Uncharacterized protein n=1 Tax=Gigaspora rosea TaxID=44941 RepID=A0A397VL15_9GLOM|nr:hypothetical protein C2G38_2173396 [Gigaspora rosea]
MVKIIIDNIYNKRVPKPSNLRPGYDMEHVFKYRPLTDIYQYKKLVRIEKEYDYLSIIKPHETPQQWANRVIVLYKSCFLGGNILTKFTHTVHIIAENAELLLVSE